MLPVRPEPQQGVQLVPHNTPAFFVLVVHRSQLQLTLALLGSLALLRSRKGPCRHHSCKHTCRQSRRCCTIPSIFPFFTYTLPSLLCCAVLPWSSAVSPCMQVTVDPETPEADELRSWWSSEGSTATITPLSQVRGARLSATEGQCSNHRGTAGISRGARRQAAHTVKACVVACHQIFQWRYQVAHCAEIVFRAVIQG